MNGIYDYFFGSAAAIEEGDTSSKSIEMKSLSEQLDSCSERQPDQPMDLLDIYPVTAYNQGPSLGITLSITYLDFFPRLLDPGVSGTTPKFDSFSSIMVQANQWLEGNPQFCLFKCETIRKKVLPGPKINFDDVLHHESSNGKNFFLFGLRLWLKAQENMDEGATTIHAPQQICCYHSVPWRCNEQNLGENSSEKYKINPFKFTNLIDKLKEINLMMKRSPLQGEILTIESVCLRSSEEMEFPAWSPEQTCWLEEGSRRINCVTVMRLFYVLGEPVKQRIGLQEFVPKITKASLSMVTKPRFESFSEVVRHASSWVQSQQNKRIVNIQSMSHKLSQHNDGSVQLLRNPMFYTEEDNVTSMYLRLLTVLYVEKESDTTRSTKVRLTRLPSKNVMENHTGVTSDSGNVSVQPDVLKSDSLKVHAKSSPNSEDISSLNPADATSSNSAELTSPKLNDGTNSNSVEENALEHTGSMMSSNSEVLPPNHPSMTPFACLTCKVFPPLRRCAQSFESFSRTVDRTSYWIKCTKAPLLMIETRETLFSANMYGTGVKEEVVLHEVNRQLGRYYLTSLWGFFSGPLEEVAMSQVSQPYVRVEVPYCADKAEGHVV